MNHATEYGVRIVPAAVDAGEPYWRVESVRHLPPEENRGKHVILVDVVDQQGQRVREDQLRIGWTWEGRRPDEPAPPVKPDKAESDPAHGNVDIFPGQHIRVWIQDGERASEQVENLHADHPDEPGPGGELWNSRGHHSFHVRFRRVQAGVGTVDGGEEGPEVAVEPADPAPPPERRIDLPADADVTVRDVVQTWNRYGGLVLEEAERLGIDPAVAVAILAVESRGLPFGPDGRLIIRFENHIFHQQWGNDHPEEFQRHFQFDPESGWKGHQWRAAADVGWSPCHLNQDVEWQVFDFARTLDEGAAMRSISMGAPQIMGFNFATVGYPSVDAMFRAFQAGAGAQLASMFRFIETNKLTDAIRRGDLAAFARSYNGPGQAEVYAGLIRRYLAAFQGVAVTVAPQAAGTPAALPMPTPPAGHSLAEVDPQLYAAWRAHMEHGFTNNQTMFDAVLKGFMNPYWTTVWMYRVLFGLGVASFIAAVVVGLITGQPGFSLVFGGLSAVTMLTYFFNRPLQALEENLQFITWLGIIYNTYWARLTYMTDPATVQRELDAATDDAVADLQTLMDRHAERSSKRPGLR